MARELDIILFGATGFTGKHTIPMLFKFCQANTPKLSWGVAGRSEKKLKDVLHEYGKVIGAQLDDISTITASVEDVESLKQMARKARIIINCCGPYQFYGEPVIKACVEEGTSHVDVSGEPLFLEEMQLKYHSAAKEKGIFIISSCGFDSIPADLGVVFLEQNFNGTLNSVTTYLKNWKEDESISGTILNIGTWKSAVHGAANMGELRNVRRQLFSNRLPSFTPKLERRNLPHKNEIINGWIAIFPFADRSVVRRSQRYFYENDSKRPVQIETYFIINSFIQLIAMGFFGLILLLLAKFDFGRNLLLKHPEKFSGGMFSRDPPSEEAINNERFSLLLHGQGWEERLPDGSDQYSSPPDKSVYAKIRGSNPGYGATCLSLTLSAITILSERDKLPSGGGVYPPGYAFAKTSLIKQLNENGLTFEVLSREQLQAANK